MSIQDDIKKLEEELALKKAYLGVIIEVGEEFPDEVRQKVELSLMECAEKLAAGEPLLNNKQNDFSEDEIKALKALASTVITKSAATTTTNQQPAEPPRNNLQSIIESSDNTLIGSSAQLLLLDNVPADQRKKVDSESIVHIKSKRRDKVFVADQKGNSFWIPMQDLDFNYNQGEASNE